MTSEYGPVQTPVLLIIFRRPDRVAATVERLREVRPARLYVAADGPRPGIAADLDGTSACRNLIETGIDWPCELHLRFRDTNLGVRHGVVDAINWIFETEETAIILEDDIETQPDFFRFCDELLDRYRADHRVATISGTSYWQGPAEFSYHPSNFIDMWGWATWRDRWRRYDAGMSAWPEYADSGRLGAMPGASPRFVRFWRRIMGETKAGMHQAWDYQWILTCWHHGLVSLHPSAPLVRNRGFGPMATNTYGHRLPRYCRPAGSLAWPLVHPSALTPDPARERKMWAFRFHISSRDALVQTAKRPLIWLRDRLAGFKQVP